MKVNIPSSNLPRVVIIGGGFGGISLAQSLKKAPVQVVMFDKHNYHTFQPLLYQVATGGLEPDSIAFPLRKMFKKQKNFFFRMAEVRKVDPKRNSLSTSIGDLDFDFLVISTGSTTNFFGLEDVERSAHGMKNIPEALDLRHLILQSFEKALLTTDLEEQDALTNFVVVGGGPTGVETAGALAELKRHILPKDYPELDLRKMQIHLVEAGERLLTSMSEDSSKNARRSLEKMGVNVWLNTQVKNYDGMTITTHSPKTLIARTVIWAAGVKGVPIGGVDFAITRGNRIQVDQFNRVKGLPNVFAIGDVALMKTDEHPHGHPMVSPVAMQQGWHLAANLSNILHQKPLLPFTYRDKGSMATIGRNRAVAETGKFKLKGWLAWVAWMGVHLFYLAGFRNRIVVFWNWFWNYLTYDKGTRLIMRNFTGKKVEETKPSSFELEPFVASPTDEAEEEEMLTPV